MEESLRKMYTDYRAGLLVASKVRNTVYKGQPRLFANDLALHTVHDVEISQDSNAEILSRELELQSIKELRRKVKWDVKNDMVVDDKNIRVVYSSDDPSSFSYDNPTAMGNCNPQGTGPQENISNNVDSGIRHWTDKMSFMQLLNHLLSRPKKT